MHGACCALISIHRIRLNEISSQKNSSSHGLHGKLFFTGHYSVKVQSPICAFSDFRTRIVRIADWKSVWSEINFDIFCCRVSWIWCVGKAHPLSLISLYPHARTHTHKQSNTHPIHWFSFISIHLNCASMLNRQLIAKSTKNIFEISIQRSTQQTVQRTLTHSHTPIEQNTTDRCAADSFIHS